MIYFDNNGTTFMTKDAINYMINIINIGNPSVCPKAKDILDNSIKRIQELIHGQNYEIIFTSGATESNCTMIRMISENYSMPHIITSTIEHSSIVDLVKILVEKKKITLTLINPSTDGMISPQEIARALRPNTKLVSIMYANNELGTINPIKEIASICNNANVPFFTDATQYFGKYLIKPNESKIDAFSFSFHKCHGPVGCGLFVIHKNLVKNYNLKAINAGEQNHNLRGGTENVASIGTAIYSLENMLSDRKNKNSYLRSLVHYLRIQLNTVSPCIWLEDFDQKKFVDRTAIILLGPKKDKDRLPNTQMFSFYYPFDPKFCNLKFKKAMKDIDIFISTGSACIKNASSYVVKAITTNSTIRRGSIRISFSDDNTTNEIDVFISYFKQYIISM